MRGQFGEISLPEHGSGSTQLLHAFDGLGPLELVLCLPFYLVVRVLSELCRLIARAVDPKHLLVDESGDRDVLGSIDLPHMLDHGSLEQKVNSSVDPTGSVEGKSFIVKTLPAAGFFTPQRLPLSDQYSSRYDRKKFAPVWRVFYSCWVAGRHVGRCVS